MAKRLRDEIALLLAEHDDDRPDPAGVRGLVRVRLATSLAEGLAGEAGVVPDEAAGTDRPARIAAFLDHGVPAPERSAMVAELAQDPTSRAELSSAAALLASVDAEPDTLPPGLLAQAGATFAPARSPAPRGAAARHRLLGWCRRPAVWASLAAVILVASLSPRVVSIIEDGRAPPSPSDKESPTSIKRGIGPAATTGKSAPARQSGEPDARSCDDPDDPARADQQSGEKKAKDLAAKPSPDATPDDPCPPKAPAGESTTTKAR